MAFHEDILEKLLRLADRPGSPGEGAAALHRAEVIAKARGINLDDVRRSMNFSSQSSARSSRWGGFGSGYTEPSDNSQDFFDQMTMFANQRQYAYQGADHRGFFNPSDGAKFHKWTYRHNSSFYVLMSHTERVRSGYEFVSQQVKNPKWMFCHIHKIQPISIGSDVDFLMSFVQSFNYKKADDDVNQEKLERERPQHVVATPSQAKLEKILLKYKYTLEPPQRPQQDNRTWDSADGASFISFGIDGDWSAFVRVGERLQSELKRAGKNRTPEELEAFLKKKATETTKLHPGQVHPEDLLDVLRQMESICRQFGYEDWSGKTDPIEFMSPDRTIKVLLYKNSGKFMVKCPGANHSNEFQLIGAGTDPMKLYTILKEQA